MEIKFEEVMEACWKWSNEHIPPTNYITRALIATKLFDGFLLMFQLAAEGKIENLRIEKLVNDLEGVTDDG